MLCRSGFILQEEVTQKTIALSMKTGKLTAQALQACLLYTSQIYRDLILENIEYDTLTQNPRIDREQLDEIVDIPVSYTHLALVIPQGGNGFAGHGVEGNEIEYGHQADAHIAQIPHLSLIHI